MTYTESDARIALSDILRRHYGGDATEQNDADAVDDILAALRADPELAAAALGQCGDTRGKREDGMVCVLDAGHEGWHRGVGSFWSGDRP